MYAFKNIDNSRTSITKTVVHHTHNLHTGSIGLTSTQYISSSLSSSYWDSLNVLFYTSGSPIYKNETKFSNNSNNLTYYHNRNNQYLNKFHSYLSGSIISVPSHYYGNSIKRKSFSIIDKSYTDNSGNNPINLYSKNFL